MAGHGPIVGFSGPLPNVQRAAQLSLAVLTVCPRGRRRACDPIANSGSVPCVTRDGIGRQRHVERLVRHTHLRIIGELFHQPTRDLLR